MLSPRSRGKGNRRWPGRDGGRRKRKPVVWRKQATHAVDDVSLLGEGLVELRFASPFRLTAAEGIYLFDQGVAPYGIRYHAVLTGSRRFPVFKVRVPASQELVVSRIIDQVQKR